MRPKRSTAAATAARPRRSRARRRGDRQALAPELLDLGSERLELVGGAHRIGGIGELRGDVERDDVVAVLGQRERGRAALPVGGAGDERERSCGVRARGSRRDRRASASLKTLVATMIAPNAVSVTICGRVEALGELRVQRVVDRVRVDGRGGGRSPRSARRSRRAADRAGSSPRVDQQPAEERRADQAVARGRDRVAEQPRAPLAEHRARPRRRADTTAAARRARPASARASTSCSSCGCRWPRARRRARCEAGRCGRSRRQGECGPSADPMVPMLTERLAVVLKA